MDAAIDLSDASKALDLANIRYQLIRLEDTITFHLIERVQFPLNKTIYVPGGVQIPNSSLSLFDWILREQERLHSLVRRYQAPDEYPFFPDALEEPILKPLNYPKVLHPNDVNFNEKLKQSYIEHILPAACAKFGREERGEAQENYGSSATCDVQCLQALSRRIHFGKYVAEAKFRKETDRFVRLIKSNDREGIDEAITDARVEKKVLERLRLKAKTYGTDPDGGADEPGKINVDAVVAMYKDYVIPLTKEVEVEYLMQRLMGTEYE
ncbi:chorismate mutase aro7 [Coniosporium tulheliwenetii]|uniref:Chorismate mutase aro7 n=1 Tax=Coniosporium tulheliwenetii TaxID=3383036 RepID=A0ACC2ZAK8_9PEZI|nr:chorismate mutase aro7 [Cladosporium sp. JES 115]